MSVVSGEYVTFKHVKTRKVVILEIEIPEEGFQDVISKLGMPIGGDSRPVAVALLNKEIITDIGIPISAEPMDRGVCIRAIMLCKDMSFWKFCYKKSFCTENEAGAEAYLKDFCRIKSRSELSTNEYARRRFCELDHAYKNWLFEQRHADSLERI